MDTAGWERREEDVDGESEAAYVTEKSRPHAPSEGATANEPGARFITGLRPR